MGHKAKKDVNVGRGLVRRSGELTGVERTCEGEDIRVMRMHFMHG